MDTLLNEDQALIREAVRDFLKSKADPERVRAAVELPERTDRALWTEICGLGWSGLCLSPDSGGEGLSLVYLGILFEELGRHIAPVPALGSLTTALLLDRTAESGGLKDSVANIVSGNLVVGLAFSDMGATGPRTGCGYLSGRRVDEGVLLDGTVKYVEEGTAAGSFLVSFQLCESDGSVLPALALVDAGADGSEVVPLLTTAKDSQADVYFTDVHVPQEHVLATGRAAADMIFAMENLVTALNVSMMAGGARRTVELASEYAKERKAFGHPIGAFQAIQHLAADMLIAVDGTDLLVREALWRMDHGLAAGAEVSQAKAFANERCVMVCRSAQQIHGGIGFMEEFDLHLWYRRVLAWSLRWGTAREHRARVASALLDTPDFVRLDMGTDAQLPAVDGAEAVFALAAVAPGYNPFRVTAAG